ncbi:MAG: hypothetical protein RSF83_02145 [Hungatella sp.]
MEENNSMAAASMILGILSLVLSCCCCMGWLPGGLAILFACLSKVDISYTQNAKIGLITGSIGLAIGMISCLLVLFLLVLNRGFS